ncbi:MAG: hypothetical protein K8R45_00015 [Desulfobacterales bacterium]|nr:hypothetical protein [Desulfobacterales bacterium]
MALFNEFNSVPGRDPESVKCFGIKTFIRELLKKLSEQRANVKEKQGVCRDNEVSRVDRRQLPDLKGDGLRATISLEIADIMC